MTLVEKPGFVPVSAEVAQAFWERWCKLGPRHRNVYRWQIVLGWKLSGDWVGKYLEKDLNDA